MNSKKVIVVFCYTRFQKLTHLINDLSKNMLFGRIKIIFIQDGLNCRIAKKELKLNHQKVRRIIEVFQKKNLNFVEKDFKSKNYGLANIIESTLDRLAKKYDSVIVLEDDLRISKNFIFLMSQLLDEFKSNNKVYHINGWAPSNFSNMTKSKIILTKMMYCWGWATWSDRWIKYRKFKTIKKKNYLNFFKLLKFDYFGLAGHYYQLNMNWKLKRKTWAIFWQLYIWSKNYYCLSLSKSIVLNDGLSQGENHNIVLKSNFFSKIVGGEVNENINLDSNKVSKNFIFECRILLQLFLRNIAVIINKFKLF
jgi:hypothetical protein